MILLFLSFLALSSGQRPSENGKCIYRSLCKHLLHLFLFIAENCYLWYYTMPSSIICREGTRFSMACQVRVPCDVEPEVNWYWSPHNAPNVAHMVTNSDTGGVRIRALLSSKATCNLNGTTMLHHFYTLSLSELSEKNIGYYWCQLKVTNETNSARGDLLPSNKCYVGIADSVGECEYGNHTDTWICARNKTTRISDSFEGVYTIEPTLLETQHTPSPTITPPKKNNENYLIRMKVTIIEVAFLCVTMTCVVIITLLICCLVRRRRKQREGKQAV